MLASRLIGLLFGQLISLLVRHTYHTKPEFPQGFAPLNLPVSILPIVGNDFIKSVDYINNTNNKSNNSEKKQFEVVA